MVVRDLVCRLGAMAIAVMIAAAALVWHGAGVAGAADMELGRYLANDCMACHRPTTGTSTIPNIFGMAETRLIEAIKAYREKTRPNSGDAERREPPHRRGDRLARAVFRQDAKTIMTKGECHD